MDLDFCYSRSKENIKRLVSALKPFSPRPRNFPTELPYIFDESTLSQATNFTFETSIGDMHLLGEIKGVGDYQAAYSRSVVFEVYGSRLNALDLDALIDAKTAADRPKDHLVLPELHALREALDPNED